MNATHMSNHVFNTKVYFSLKFFQEPFLPRFCVSVHLYTCVWLKIKSLGYCRAEALERGNGDGDGGTPPHTSGGFVDLGAKLTRTTTALSRYTKRTRLLGFARCSLGLLVCALEFVVKTAT